MIEIRFEVDGRALDPATMPPGLPRTMLKTIRQALADQIGDVTCDCHHRQPRILCKGPSVVELSMELCGCCDRILDTLESRLN